MTARWSWLIAIAFAYLYVFPYFPGIRSANELPRVYLVRAIADDHTFQIDRGVDQWGETVDVSPSGGHKYSNKAPGSSMIAAPVYAAVRVVGDPGLGGTMWLCRFASGIVPMIAFLWLLWGFLERFAPDPAIRRLVLLAYGLGSMAMTYSMLFYSHQLAAICIASAWIMAIDVADRRRGLWAMAAAGALAGAAPLADYQAAFAGVPVAVHVVAKMWRWPRKELLRAIGIAAAAAAVPIAILLAYHAACFGSPLRTGYNASTTFAHFHQEGFLGITKLRWEAFWGSFFAVDNGLVTLAPWLLLAIPGGVALARRDRGTAWTCAAIAVIYILFISSINFWRGGWGVGPRYVTVMLPFLLPMIATQLEAWRDKAVVIAVCAGAMLVGIAIYTLSTATFPYWPDSIHHPLYDVTFRLLGDGLAAPTLLSVAGVTGVAALVPYVAVVGAITGASVRAACGWRGVAIAVGVAVAALLAYGIVAHGGPGVARPYAFVRGAVIERT